MLDPATQGQAVFSGSSRRVHAVAAQRNSQRVFVVRSDAVPGEPVVVIGLAADSGAHSATSVVFAMNCGNERWVCKP